MTTASDRQKIVSVVEYAIEDAFKTIERRIGSKYDPSEIKQVLAAEFDLPEYWKQWWLACDEEWR